MTDEPRIIGGSRLDLAGNGNGYWSIENPGASGKSITVSVLKVRSEMNTTRVRFLEGGTISTSNALKTPKVSNRGSTYTPVAVLRAGTNAPAGTTAWDIEDIANQGAPAEVEHVLFVIPAGGAMTVQVTNPSGINTCGVAVILFFNEV